MSDLTLYLTFGRLYTCFIGVRLCYRLPSTGPVPFVCFWGGSDPQVHERFL